MARDCTSPHTSRRQGTPARTRAPSRGSLPAAGSASAHRAAPQRSDHSPREARLRRRENGGEAARQQYERADWTWRNPREPATETGKRGERRASPLRRHTQPLVRGLRIAANRSANIGGSLTTPAPRWTGPTEKDA